MVDQEYLDGLMDRWDLTPHLPGIVEVLGSWDGPVVLQLPEGLLPLATTFAERIHDASGNHPSIIYQPTFGSCDIPLDTLDVGTLVIHLGHAPLSRFPPGYPTSGPDASSSNIVPPLLYRTDDGKGVLLVPIEDTIPRHIREKLLERTNRELAERSTRSIAMLTTIQHRSLLAWMVEHLRDSAIERGSTLNCTVPMGGDRVSFPGHILGCDLSSVDPVAPDMDVPLLFLGSGLFHPLGMAVSSRRPVLRLDTTSGDVEWVDPDRLVRTRFGLAARIKEVEKVGLLVSRKLGQYRDPAPFISLLKEQGKKVSIYEGDTLSPGNLANLPEDVFVSLACPRLALDDGSRSQGGKTILTPFEARMGLGLESPEDYSMDELRTPWDLEFVGT